MLGAFDDVAFVRLRMLLRNQQVNYAERPTDGPNPRIGSFDEAIACLAPCCRNDWASACHKISGILRDVAAGRQTSLPADNAEQRDGDAAAAPMPPTVETKSEMAVDSAYPKLSQGAYRLLDYLSRCPHGDYTPDFPNRIIDDVDIAELWDVDDVESLKLRKLVSIKENLPGSPGGFVKITAKGRAWLAEAKRRGNSLRTRAMPVRRCRAGPTLKRMKSWLLSLTPFARPYAQQRSL